MATRRRQNETPRRLLVHVKLYAADSVKPFAVEGDEVEEGLLSPETVKYLISTGQAEWVEDS